MRSLRATSSFRGANRPTHMGDVRDAESHAWNDYLAFFRHSELAEESSEA